LLFVAVLEASICEIAVVKNLIYYLLILN
jgi:hypothetical protein